MLDPLSKYEAAATDDMADLLEGLMLLGSDENHFLIKTNMG